MTVQYSSSIKKGLSEDVDALNPNIKVIIGRYKSDILSREGVTRWFYSGVQSCILSHRLESFESEISLKWKVWMCFKYGYNWFAKAQQGLE